MHRMYVNTPLEYLRGIYFIAVPGVPFLFKINNAVVMSLVVKNVVSCHKIHARSSFFGESVTSEKYEMSRILANGLINGQSYYSL